MCVATRKAPRGQQRFSGRNGKVKSRTARKQFYGSGNLSASQLPLPMEGTLTVTIMLQGGGFEQKRFPLKGVPLCEIALEIGSPVSRGYCFLVDTVSTTLVRSGCTLAQFSQTAIVYRPCASDQKPRTVPVGQFETISFEIHRNGNLTRIDIAASGEFHHDTRQV